MNEREALIRAILIDPADDTVRLAFADWLDENGGDRDRDRAEQIRVQIEFPAERLELLWKHPAIEGVTGFVIRGFVAHIDLTTRLYLDGAVELFREYPVTSVALSDKHPAHDNRNGAFTWHFGGRPDVHHNEAVLPESFAKPMERHPLRRPGPALAFDNLIYARLAASEVAVNVARHLNDLPPLPFTSSRQNGDPV